MTAPWPDPWRMTGSAGRAGRFTYGAGTLVSNNFLFLREGAGRETSNIPPRPEAGG